jgi:hypothetical protein
MKVYYEIYSMKFVNGSLTRRLDLNKNVLDFKLNNKEKTENGHYLPKIESTS